jgi:hypothetical protein
MKDLTFDENGKIERREEKKGRAETELNIKWTYPRQRQWSGGGRGRGWGTTSENPAQFFPI